MMYNTYFLHSADYGVHAVIMISSFVFVICVVAILICKVKAWTMKTPLPKLLVKCSTGIGILIEKNNKWTSILQRNVYPSAVHTKVLRLCVEKWGCSHQLKH